MASVIFWAVLGGLAGAFAKLVLWDTRSETWFWTMLLSIGGGVAGGFAGTSLGSSNPTGIPAGFEVGSMVLAPVAAALVLAAYQLWAEHRAAAPLRGTARRTAA